MDDLNGIAVIGMSCRFPGANNIEEFWNNLKNGVESVTFFSDPEIADAGVDLNQIKDGNYVRASCIIDDIDLFDNRFFGYSPKETETIDPQQRLFLMCAWECLEDAGYVPGDYDGFIGVFGGMRLSSYVNYLNFNFAHVGTSKGFLALIGNDKDYLATRISYKLNLKGPGVSIQTACSTSLVAVHMACESLRNGECDMALAGGSAITVPLRQGYFYQKDMIFSADGHCRAFDANANGIVGGNGLGVVLLKPLEEALEDKDNIYAVIKSSAVNNDGTAKAGFTAPSIEGQTAVISEALAMAEVKAEDITFIETHGTGTALGDPIEVEALDRVFREETGKKSYCSIGSVKTNVGHLDTAAGICSFIKTVLALKHKQIPPSLNFIEPNPRIDFKNTPFFVNTQLTDWQGNGALRTAGVSSFGIGGTNAHVIVQEKPELSPMEDKKQPPYHVLTISAQSEKTLKKYAEKYREFFSKHPDINVADVCFTANTGRVHFSHRLAMTIDTPAKALKMLDAFLAGKKIIGLARGVVPSKSGETKIAFLFTGQGSQYFNMGVELYNTQPVFKQEIDKCSEILSKYMDKPLLALLYNMPVHHTEVPHQETNEHNEKLLRGVQGAPWHGGPIRDGFVAEDVLDNSTCTCNLHLSPQAEKSPPGRRRQIIDETQYAQPVLFAFEYALAKMLESWGIRPSAVMGHSVGEYAAACIAGVFSLEDGLKLMATRAKLMQDLPKNGMMAAVLAEPRVVQKIIENNKNQVSAAAINGPGLTVISGLKNPVKKITRELKNQGIECRVLNVSHAFHSPLMDPILPEFKKTAGTISYSSPKIHMISNTSGNLVTNDGVCNPGYWCEHIQKPVRFTDGIKTLSENGYKLFVEIGPEPTLTGLGRRCLPKEEYEFVPTLKKNTDDWNRILNAFGMVYTRGFDIDWQPVTGIYDGHRITLPTYPFDLKRFWVETTDKKEQKTAFDVSRTWDHMVEQVKTFAQQEIKDEKIVQYKEVEDLVKRLCCFYIGNALNTIDAFEQDEPLSIEGFLFRTPVIPRHRQFLYWLLQGMVREGFLEKHQDEYKNLKPIPGDESSQLLQQIKESGLFSDYDSVIEGINRVGERLSDILTGDEEAVNILYPGHSYEFVERLYGDTRFSQYYNGMIREAVKGILMTMPRENKIRILEISDNTGALTRQLLPELPGERTRYVLTGNSASFKASAEKGPGTYSFVNTDTLDIMKSPGEQGFQENQFDMVIAGNILHTAFDISEALKHIQWLLAPNGILVAREPGENHLLFNMLFGALTRELEDEDMRDNQLFLSALKWQEVLKGSGFAKTIAFDENNIYGEQIIIAQTPGSAENTAVPAFSLPMPTIGTAIKGSDLSGKHPWLDQRYHMALPVFQGQLDCEQTNFIEDHKIYGVIVVPGTVFFETASAAVREVFKSHDIILQNLKVVEPLIFSNNKEKYTLQVVFTHKSSMDASFKIFSRNNNTNENEESWKMHCSGDARVKSSQNQWVQKEKFLLDHLQNRCNREFPVQEFYESFWKSGLAYGTEFQGIKKLWQGDKESLGLIELPRQFVSRAAIFHHHPVILDACLQISMLTLPAERFLGDAPDKSAYMLVGIEAMNFAVTPLPAKLWSHARLRDTRDDTWDSFAIDYFFYNTENQPVGEVVGMQMKRAPREVVKQIIAGEKENDLLYQIEWIPYQEPTTQTRDLTGTCLIFADQPGLGQSLAGLLEEQGVNCVLVGKADEFKCIDSKNFVINPTNPHDFKSLFKTAFAQEGASCHDIVYLWALDSPGSQSMTPDSLKQSQDKNLAGALHLVRVLADEQWSEQPCLYLVTRNSQPFNQKKSSSPISLAQSTLWGLGKVIAIEYPGLPCKMVDLDDNDLHQNRDSLEKVIRGQSPENQLALRDSVTYIPRLVRTFFEFPADNKRSNITPDGTYLVTGALGGIGLELAKWLAAQGARHLLLVGRSEPSEKTREILSGLKTTGTEVKVIRADVSQETGVIEKIKPFLKDMPDLRGVFHLAGIVDDNVLAQQDWQRFDRVLAPKVYGAWNIHHLVKDSPLDFFILFSSTASMLGSYGQGNYAAANSFLDALAYYRQQQGLPALSINWGAWAEVGMVVKNDREQYLQSYGMGTLNPNQGLEMLGNAISQQGSQLGIMSVDWKTLFQRFSKTTQIPVLAKLADQFMDNAGITGGERHILTDLREADPEERKRLIEAYLISTFADLLRLEKEELSLDVDFFQLGMDSLQFMELNQILAKELQIRITAAEAFENPYIKSLAERLFYELEKRIDHGSPAPSAAQSLTIDPVSAVGGPIVPDKEQQYEPFDLTNVQYAYWIGRSGVLDLGNVSCHFYFEVDADSLDIPGFNWALQQLIKRHGMLRSIILPSGKQKVLETVPPYRVNENDLSGLSTEQVESRLLEIREEMSHEIISSDEWPLFEIAVSVLPKDQARLHFSLDLLIADVRSIQIIFDEIGEFLNNPDYNPAPLELSFRDYVQTEEAFKETGLYKQSREYWLKRIPGMPGPPGLPLIKKPEAIKEQRFTSRNFRIDKETWSRLKEKAAKAGVTPSGILLAAYGEILANWSGNSQFIISLTQFNRIPFHPEVNSIIGDFTSIIVMAMDTTRGNSFLERAKEIQKELWGHLENRYFDGIEVLREMARGKRSDEALIPVVFTSIMGVGEYTEELYPWAVLGKVGYFVSQTPQVWLDNQVSERNGYLIINWDAVDELFPNGMLDDMLKSYENYILDLANRDDAWNEPGTIFLTENQKQELLAINSTGTEISKEMLHTLFTKQVEKRKENPAVIIPGKEITYQELDTMSHHTAYILRELGVRPNSFTAVVMEKGWEQVPAVLGILKSGAAYLPVDAAVPGERLLHLLKDAEVKVVLTQSKFENKVQWPDSVKVISVDKLTGTKIKPEPPANVQSAGDIAYVIYTSGSTGVPKGVVIDHRGAVNTILDINQRFHVNSDDRVLALSALSFDLSVYDIFGMLASGGSIVIPEADKEKDPGHWWELLETRQITLWDSVPALMQMLVEYTSGIPESIPQSLRLILLSGDWIPLHLPDQVRDLFKNAGVISLGGATEASIWSILYPIKEIDPAWKSIPYGAPMWNQSFYVLDRQMHLCPHWVPGQLFIGGIGAAKGYLNDQEKTNNSFIFHPGFGERLYKTGDLGRYLADGNIEFLGREDFQVKVRGHRIEPGEIEANINAHPGVQEVVVNVYGEARADKRLFAYIVPKPGDESLFEIEAVDPSQLEKRWKSLNQAGQKQAKNIPGSLSPGSFPVFWDYTENLSTAIICQVLLDLGVFVTKQESISLSQLMTEFSIEPQFENLMHQWLDVLVTKMILKGDEDDYFTNPGPGSLLEHSLSKDLLDEMNSPANWKDLAVDLLSFFREASPIYTSLLKGEMNPLELFLKEDSLFTAERMSRFNPIAPYTRQIALGIIGCMTDSFSKKPKLRILEIGTRTGSMTRDILAQLSPEQVTYVYTDESSFFLDKARADYENYPCLEYKILDINNDPQGQGFDQQRFDLIIAENTLHRARHLGRTLSYLDSLLAAGGILLIAEGTRNSLMQLVTVGFFEDGFSHFEDQRKETRLPLLSAESWQASLRASGFEDVGIFPAADLPANVFNQVVMIARAKNDVKHFIPGKLRTFLQEKIPAYMIPSEFILVDSFPLTPNGKIDRKALPVPVGEVKTRQTGDYEAPGTPVEKTVADTWAGILKKEGIGIHDDFLALGGDSLQATQAVNILRDTFNIDIPLRIMFERTTIFQMANFIETALQTQQEENEFEEGII